MLPFENFVHCEKELWVHWGERWHNWFNIKFSFFRWNFFMVWWMDQQFLGMWLDSNHHHDRHKKCRREWIDILMQQSVSTLSPSGFVMSTIKLTERGDLQSSETAEQITKKTMICLCNQRIKRLPCHLELFIDFLWSLWL